MRTLLLSATALALLAGPAAADASSCKSMIQSFDRAYAASGKAAKITEAKKHRDAGAAELAKGHELACLTQLKRAQDSIGTEEVDASTSPRPAAD
jgi:hypothetical protein